MSRTVFILGAGASKLAGAPLMHEFLDVADDLRHAKEPGETFDDFELVFRAIYALRPAYANANVDLSNNIESVFAAFEMARLIRQLGNLFADLLKNISKPGDRNPNTASVLTFNYDLCIDYALHFNSIHSNYCLGGGT